MASYSTETVTGFLSSSTSKPLVHSNPQTRQLIPPHQPLVYTSPKVRTTEYRRKRVVSFREGEVQFHGAEGSRYVVLCPAYDEGRNLGTARGEGVCQSARRLRVSHVWEDV